MFLELSLSPNGEDEKKKPRRSGAQFALPLMESLDYF